MIHRQAIGAQFLGTYREKQRGKDEQWLPHRAPLLQRGNGVDKRGPLAPMIPKKKHAMNYEPPKFEHRHEHNYEPNYEAIVHPGS